MASLGGYYGELVGIGGMPTTSSGTTAASTLSANAVDNQMRAMEKEMYRMKHDAEMEREARRNMEKMMYYGSPQQYAPAYPMYDMYGRFEPMSPVPPPKPKHLCKVSGNKRHDSYTAGIVDYHRKKGIVDVEALEKDCAEPTCVLARIKKP